MCNERFHFASKMSGQNEWVETMENLKQWLCEASRRFPLAAAAVFHLPNDRRTSSVMKYVMGFIQLLGSVDLAQ